MTAITDALREHHERLQQMSDELADMGDQLEGGHADIDSRALRELLISEFRPGLSDPGRELWLETVVRDVILEVAGPVARFLQAKAQELDEFAYEVDVEESAKVAAAERRLHCLDCRVHTGEIGEYYMLREPVWAATGVESDGGMLCIGCAEKRLGRMLGPDDFNDPQCNVRHRSERLRSRLALEESPAA